jgi:tetratricopeptide (TPR) repeat protein
MNLRATILVLAILLNTLIISCSNGQSPQNANAAPPTKPITYTEWKEEAKTNMRLLPKYGNQPKTEAQKEADNELINTYLKQQGTRRKASEVLIKLGFDYLYRGNIKTAMYRFNQAWLLDSSNVDVHWGFGAIYHSLGDYGSAMKQYDEGLSVDPRNSKIITDKATISMVGYYTTKDSSKLKEAIFLLEQSYGLDAKNQNTLFKLSICYFLSNDCIKAKKYYNECMALGGKPVTKEYTKALNEKCKGS